MPSLRFFPRFIPHTLHLTWRTTAFWLAKMTNRTAKNAKPPSPPPPSTKPSPPAPHLDATLTELHEGEAKALYQKPAVFYNPAQVVNRDLSVLLLRWLTRQPPFFNHPAPPRKLRVLEALSATGLRSIRYFKEVPNVHNVLANDLDPAAVQTIARNVAHNGLSEQQVTPSNADAVSLMANARPPNAQFDVVDLDPYGSAAPFLEMAVQSVAHAGLLAVTCTDLAVLCGNSPEICFTRYCSTPLKGPTSHEMAIRIVLAAIQTAANRHGRAVVPVLCVKIDFYVRLFVRVMESKQLAQQTASNMSLVLQCNDCSTQRFQPLGRVKRFSSSSKKKRTRASDETVPPPLIDAPSKPSDAPPKPADAPPKPADSPPKPADASPKPTDAPPKPADAPPKPADAPPKPEMLYFKYSPALANSYFSDKCSICDGPMLIGGPMWNGPLIGEGVAASLLSEIESGAGTFKARERVSAIVRLLDEEVNQPLFLHLPTMCKVLHISPPPGAAIRNYLTKKGYKVSQSHTDPQAIKTDADPRVVWEILQVWGTKCGSHGSKKKNTNPTETTRPSTGERIMKKGLTMVDPDEIDFSVKRDKFVRRGQANDKGVRFPLNPEPNWGPKSRAGKRRKIATKQSVNPLQ